MQKASISQIKNLKKQKRENSFLLFLDNKKIVNDAIKNGHTVKIALTSDENFMFENIESDKIFLTDEKTISSLVDSKTPQGVCVMLEYTQDMVKLPKANFLVLDGLQDPGNVGTLVRTAKACGFEDVYLVESVNQTNMKMIRSSAGANFDINLFSLSRKEFVNFAKENDFQLVKCDMNGENVFDFQTTSQIGVVVGNEGKGVSKEISNLCKKTLSIPMKSGIESLNAGVSGSIVMYQINKFNI